MPANQTSTDMTAYFLPQWIYLCFTGDGAVFLDIRHDKYSGLDPARTQLLAALLAGNNGRVECEMLANELVNAGLLSPRSNEHTRPLAATSFDPPESVLWEPDDDIPTVTALHVIRFLASCISVWAALHWRSLEYALARLQARKARLTSNVYCSSNVATAKQLASVFVYLRTFVYTASDHCLYDSLVLSTFLHRYRIPSTCVFGVRTLPFSAHCWVQTDRALMTEVNLEYVATFSPICTI
jgi:hypothetical protein